MPLFGSATPATPPPLQPFTPSPFVPAVLEILPQWICWKAVWRGAKGKWDKLPVSVVTGSGVGFLEAQNQVGYDEAIRYAERHDLSGVGFVLMGGDILGIDLDGVRNLATGVIEPWAFDILRRTRTYAEISPSRQGVRLFAIGDLDGKSMIKSSPAKVEMYVSGRYLTFTGDHLPGSPFDVEEDPQTVQALKDRVNKITLLSGSPVPAGTVNSLGHSQASPDPGSDEEFRRYAYGQTFFGKVNKLAMEHLPEWVGELFPAARAYQTGFRVASKDLGRDLEEDISILPAGIVDFGVHDLGDERQGKRTPVDLVVEWLEVEEGALTPAGAALWLCEKLGVDPSSLGYRGVAVDNGDSGETPGTAGTELDDVLPGKRQAKAPPPPTIRLSDELAKPGFEHTKPATILPGIERGEVTLIAGAPGAMKSLWAVQTAIAIVSGQEKVAGVAKLRLTGSVLLYAHEDTREVILKRYASISKFYALAPPFPHEFLLRTERLLGRNRNGAIVPDAGEVAEIERLIQDEKLVVVVVDTLAAAVLSEETNLEFQQTTNHLRALAQRLKIAVILVHHFRKGSPGPKAADAVATLDDIRGGSALVGATRNVLLVEPPNKNERDRFGLDVKRVRKLQHRKNNNGALDDDRWFELTTVGIPCRDPETGTVADEQQPALVWMVPDAMAAQMEVMREVLGKLEARIAAGQRTRWSPRNDGQADLAQTVLGMDTAEADKILTEMENRGVIKRVPGVDTVRRKPIIVVNVQNSAPLTAPTEDIDDIDENGSGL
jgi:hypothetical protein